MKKKGKNNNISSDKKSSSFILYFFVILVLISSLAYFTVSLINFISLGDFINGLLMLGIAVLFIVVCLTNPSKKKWSSYLALGVLFIYQGLLCLVNLGIIVWPSKVMDNFVGKSLTEVIEWASANKISTTQEYEYSDMIPEYHVINQSVEAGVKLKDVKTLTVAISEGPSPYKEIVLPNMIGWKTEDVLKFVEGNYLTNVSVDFVQGTEEENTLISQSKSGNVRRNDEIKLTFSYGQMRNYSEVKLIDLTNKGKFEAEFYLKQYGITYEFDYDFSDKVKRGNVMRQSIEAGSVIAISGDNVQTLKVTISKGPKIVIPDLSKLSVSEITSWVIDHKLKIEFKDRYDDSVKENEVLEVNYKNGDVVEEGTIIIVTLSKGCLVMEKFDSYADFRNWADTYGVKYEEEHEFSDSVKVGEVIKYSYEAGSAIKNDDVVIVTISDGKKIKVPSVKGLTKSNAINKLESAGLGYSFVYKYSNDVEKGKVITQSITAGSEVSEGTTVTVTLSNGAKPSASNNNSSSNSGSSSGSNSGSSSESPSTPTCTPTTYKISRELNNIFDSGDSFSSVQSQLYSFFANNYPNVKISVVAEADTGMSSGSYIGGIGPGSEITSCNSSPYVIKLAK